MDFLRHPRRPRRPRSRLLATLSLVLLVAAACATTEQSVEINPGAASAFGFRNVAPEDADSGATNAERAEGAVLADLVRPLSPIEPGTFPERREVNRPIGLRAPTIEVEAASVVDVGVADDGYLAVPAASEVGWYQFGPSPGETGSAVLAAHIAFNGQDGVFRNLPDLAVGHEVFVQYEDGTERGFEILGIVQYDKDNLPIEDLFERRGQPRLVLITCGGDFNPQLSSYDDNIIAYAVPL